MSKITITKEKIANNLHNALGFSTSICEDLVADVFDEIIDLMQRDTKMMLNKFGTFKISQKKSRPGFNIHSNQRIEITSRKVLQFSSSQILRDKLNRV